MLAIAVQQSLEDSNSNVMHFVPQLEDKKSSRLETTSSSDRLYERGQEPVTPNRLETALSIAGTSSSRMRPSTTKERAFSSPFGRPALLSSSSKGQLSTNIGSKSGSTVDSSAITNFDATPSNPEDGTVRSLFGAPILLPTLSTDDVSSIANTQEEFHFATAITSQVEASPDTHGSQTHMFTENATKSDKDADHYGLTTATSSPAKNHENHAAPLLSLDSPTLSYADNPEDDGSRAPSPSHDPFGLQPLIPSHQEEEWDAANEVDVRAEEGEFARFMSHVKGKTIDDVRKEIDDEIQHLNHRRKAALRDSEDVTQQMITQIMVCSFRIFGQRFVYQLPDFIRRCYASSVSPTSQRLWKRKPNVLS